MQNQKYLQIMYEYEIISKLEKDKILDIYFTFK